MKSETPPPSPSSDDVDALRAVLRPLSRLTPPPGVEEAWRSGLDRMQAFPERQEPKTPLLSRRFWLVLAAGNLVAACLVLALLPSSRVQHRGHIVSIEVDPDSKDACSALRHFPWLKQVAYTVGRKTNGTRVSSHLHAVAVDRGDKEVEKWVEEIISRQAARSVRIVPILVEEPQNMASHLAEKWFGWKGAPDESSGGLRRQVESHLASLGPVSHPPRREASNEMIGEVFEPAALAGTAEVSAVPASYSP